MNEEKAKDRHLYTDTHRVPSVIKRDKHERVSEALMPMTNPGHRCPGAPDASKKRGMKVPPVSVLGARRKEEVRQRV